MYYNYINNVYNTVYCMQYFITVFVYCTVSGVYTDYSSVGEGATSQRDNTYALYYMYAHNRVLFEVSSAFLTKHFTVRFEKDKYIFTNIIHKI